MAEVVFARNKEESGKMRIELGKGEYPPKAEGWLRYLTKNGSGWIAYAQPMVKRTLSTEERFPTP